MYSLPLSLVKPSPSSIKGDVLSPNTTINSPSVPSIEQFIQHTTTESPGSDLEHTFEHLAHSGVPITLGPSDQNPIGPLAPPIFLLLVCNPTANFEHRARE